MIKYNLFLFQELASMNEMDFSFLSEDDMRIPDVSQEKNLENDGPDQVLQNLQVPGVPDAPNENQLPVVPDAPQEIPVVQDSESS